MSQAFIFIACFLTMIVVIAIGAYLVMHDHLWVGVFVIFIGGCVSISTGKKEST